MSGIYGIINLKGNPVEKSQMDRMEALLIHRGIDGKAQWIDNTVGLGHLKLEITPESEYERLPLEYKQWVITADARIDNRDELHEPLSISEEEQPLTPDTTYIVKAYEKWGKDCVKHLIGDFAFAIWDKVEKTLFCARDHIGIKPFFYLKTEDKFIFASELKTIVELREIIIKFNESKLEDWILQIPDLNNPEETLFINVKKLLPANIGILRLTKFFIQKYWKLEQNKDIKLRNYDDDIYSRELRDLIVKAVECRIRTKHDIGMTLSGGLDSSSVACIAAKKLAIEGRPLFTASSSLPKNWIGEEEDERKYINAIISQEKNIKPIFISDYKSSLMDSIDDYCNKIYQPANPFFYRDIAISSALSQKKTCVILNGFAGDMAVSKNIPTHFITLLTQHSFKTAINYLNCQRLIEQSYINILKKEVRTLFKASILHIAKYFSKFGLVKSNRDKFLQEYKSASIDNQIEMSLSSCLSIFEEFNTHNSHYNCEELMPLADVRILEFMVNTPLKYYFFRGHNRGSIRFAMNGILPEIILLRQDKSLYVPNHNFLVLSDKKIVDYLTSLCKEDIPRHYNITKLYNMVKTGKRFKNWSAKNFNTQLIELIKIISIIKINKKFHKT